MRTFPTGRRLALGGLTALAGLLLAAGPAAAAEGVVRITDGKAGVVPASHSTACDDTGVCRVTGGRALDCCDTGGGCCQNGNGCCENGGYCNSRGGCAANGECRSGGRCACGSGCQCGKAGCGGKKGGLLGGLFGGKQAKNCRCGDGCRCGRNSGIKLCGGSGRLKGNRLGDLNGDGYLDPVGDGVCRKCGARGSLYGQGYCGHCCGGLCLPGIPIPCIGIPVPGCFAGCNGGALGGCYGRVYALNPYYHDFRDGAVYAAQGYNAPMAVPLAPNVDYTMNYGWGIPSSRLTPVSRVVPSPYAPQPAYAVPQGYVPLAAAVAPANAKADEAKDDGDKADTNE
jgi:hypothetical protein